MNNFDVLSLFSRYGYWIIFFGVMLDNGGLPIPGELFLLTSGALVGIGKMDFLPAFLVSMTGAVAGDTFSYYIGRWGGRKLMNVYNGCSLCPAVAVDRVRLFYDRFGLVTIPVAKFAVGVRVLSSPFAGALRVSYIKFLFLDSIGAAFWSGVYLTVGFILRNGILDVIPVLEKIRYGIVAVFVLVTAVFILFKYYRRLRSGKPDLWGFIGRLRSAPKRD